MGYTPEQEEYQETETEQFYSQIPPKTPMDHTDIISQSSKDTVNRNLQVVNRTSFDKMRVQFNDV